MRTLVCVMIAFGLLAAKANGRIWTDKTGKAKVDAEFLGMENGMVKLKFSRTGKVAMLPLETFSDADQQYVKKQPATINTPWRTAEPVLASLERRLLEAGTAAPQNAQPHVLLGILLIQVREFEEAIPEFDEALKLAPDSPYAFNGRGLARRKQDDLAAAWKDFDRAISLAPQWSGVYLNRAEYYHRLSLAREIDPTVDGMIKSAKHRLDKLRERERQNSPWQPSNHFDTRDINRPAVLRVLGSIDSEQARQIERSDKDFERACALLDKGNVDEAELLLSKSIGRDAVSSPSYRKRADAYLRLGEWKKAITDLSMAIQINPRDAGALRDLARAYEEVDKTRDN